MLGGGGGREPEGAPEVDHMAVEVVERDPAGEGRRAAKKDGGGAEEGLDVVAEIGGTEARPEKFGGAGLASEPREGSGERSRPGFGIGGGHEIRRRFRFRGRGLSLFERLQRGT